MTRSKESHATSRRAAWVLLLGLLAALPLSAQTTDEATAPAASLTASEPRLVVEPDVIEAVIAASILAAPRPSLWSRSEPRRQTRYFRA